MNTKVIFTWGVFTFAMSAFGSLAQVSDELSTGPRPGLEVNNHPSTYFNRKNSPDLSGGRVSSGSKELTSIHDTIYTEHFDNGAPGWTFQDLWSESFWHTSTAGAYSGHSYWCGIEELGGYGNFWEQTLTSPPVSLSGTTAPVLSFMHDYRVQSLTGNYFSGFDSWDAVTVRISTDGIHFSVITPSTGTLYNIQSGRGFYYRYGVGVPGWAGSSGGWVPSGFNLAAYAGQTVWIQFLFGSDDGNSTQDESDLFGWRIDNISITDGTMTIFQDDAGDTGAAKFVPGGPGGPNPWHFTTAAYASPPTSAGCFDPVSGNYFSGMKAALVSPAIPIKNLMPGTRKLTADFQYKGVFDHTKDASGNNDHLYSEVRKRVDGTWSYWQFLSADEFVPGSFGGFNENNFSKQDVSGLFRVDSVQFRLVVITQADSAVVTPAKLFLDNFVLYATSGYEGPRFGAFYDRIMSVPEQARTAIADSFMATVPSFPFVEEKSVVTFLYRGEADTITIPGDANFNDPNGSPMALIPGTNLWFAQSVYEPDARMEYRFLINNVNWINDPLNLHQANYGSGNSVIEMPDYVPPQEIGYLPDIPHGTYSDTSFYSAILGDSRTIRVYLPPSYMTAVNDSFPVVLFHDGLDCFHCSYTNNILDYLISNKLIRPVIAVFVQPRDRDNEYAFDKTSQFESFIITELMPVIDAKYRILRDPASRAMFGYSYGGLISTQICSNHPESFGLVGAFSPSYWPKGNEVERNFANSPKKNLKFYIEWGTYEPWLRGDAMIMRDILVAQGYNPLWNQWHEGHTCGNWRAHFDLALEYFFPSNPGGVENKDNFQSALKCYPNPSTGKITIETSDKTDNRSLSVLDLAGRQILTSQISQVDITLDISMLPNGVYIVKVVGKNRVQLGKFVKQ
ncbi:MAG: alpha/beta hydrolase-fold protein [Bacteroidetes bacterium]|nr:alpha/beta hydrolase-fold protein [Bacteroidota bacterium]